MKNTEKILTYVRDNFDSILTIVASLLAIMFSIFNIEIFVVPAISAALTLIAITLLQDRKSANNLRSHISNLENTINKFTGKSNADEFFTSDVTELNIISCAKEEILLIQETGSLVFEQPAFLENFIKRGGKVKVILASDNQQVIESISFRNKNLDYDAIIARKVAANSKIASLRNRIPNQNDLEIRHISYSLDITAVFVDSNSSNISSRIALIRMVGFQNDF